MSQGRPTIAEATAYAEEYILHGDQAKAFRAAFPKSKGKPKTINSKASRIHKTDNIQARIKELQKVLKIQSEEEFSLSVSNIKQMLATAAAKGLKNRTDAQGNSVPVSIAGAVSALTEINRMDGNHAPAKTEDVTPRRQPVDPSDTDALRALIVSDED